MHSTSKDEPPGDHKQDLSTILTNEERLQLTLLIANIAEVMRGQVKSTFDASVVKGKQPQQALRVMDRNPNVDEKHPKKETEEEEKARKLREKRKKELSAPKMLELKKYSVSNFQCPEFLNRAISRACACSRESRNS